MASDTTGKRTINIAVGVSRRSGRKIMSKKHIKQDDIFHIGRLFRSRRYNENEKYSAG